MLEFWQMMSLIVTSIGLPLGVFAFLLDKRKERETDEEQVFEAVNSSYESFLRLVIDHPDLKLRSRQSTRKLSPDQQDRIFALFEILIAVFERGYLYLYEKNMSGKKLQRWLSWENFMREWCRRDDFRTRLPELLTAEDSEFSACIRRIADEESRNRANEPT